VVSASAGDTVLVGPGDSPDTTHVWVDGKLRSVCVAIEKSIALLSEQEQQAQLALASEGVGVYMSGVDSTAVVRGFDVKGDLAGIVCVDLQRIAPTSFEEQVGILIRFATPRVLRNCVRQTDIGMVLPRYFGHLDKSIYSYQEVFHVRNPQAISA